MRKDCLILYPQCLRYRGGREREGLGEMGGEERNRKIMRKEERKEREVERVRGETPDVDDILSLLSADERIDISTDCA